MGERKRVSPVLEVGQISEKVTVETQVELVQTEKGSLESIVERKQILELPLNGRNPVELVRLIPGMRFLGQNGPERGIFVQGLGNRTGDGGGTEFQVDGLNSNAGMDEGGFGIPNVDTIAEFNVETADFSAEHGRNAVQVLAATKSGTNGFHGTLWEFHRNNALDAFNTFAKTPGANKPKLTFADLRVNSPYNTYLHTGLPPGPIASPGLASLAAALGPANVGYLYYLADSSGHNHYATTYQEFLQLRAKYTG